MQTILVAGATGLVGGHVLALAQDSPLVARIVAPTRRPLAPHPKLCNPLCDFAQLPQDAQWWAVDAVVCALGTTRARAGSAEAFRAVDLHLQLKIAQLTRARGAKSLALCSSMGASAKSVFLYLRSKGELEEAVAALAWPSLSIVQPGQLLGERSESRPLERASAGLLRALGPLLPKALRGSPAPAVARVLLQAALTASPGRHCYTAANL